MGHNARAAELDSKTGKCPQGDGRNSLCTLYILLLYFLNRVWYIRDDACVQYIVHFVIMINDKRVAHAASTLYSYIIVHTSVVVDLHFTIKRRATTINSDSSEEEEDEKKRRSTTRAI